MTPHSFDISVRRPKNLRVREIAAHPRPAQLVLACLDSLILLAGGLVAAWVRFGSWQFTNELDRMLDHPGFIAYAVLAQLGLAITFDLYRPESWRTRDYLLARMAALGISLAMALALGTYLVFPWRFGRGLLALTLLFALPIQALLRFMWFEVN